MTIKQNTFQSQIPIIGNWDLKIEVLMDTKTGQSEIRIKEGTTNCIQMAGILMEHAVIQLRAAFQQDKANALKASVRGNESGNESGNDNANNANNGGSHATH